MTHLFNDPAEFKADVLKGFAAAYPQYVQRVQGASGFVRARAARGQGQPGDRRRFFLTTRACVGSDSAGFDYKERILTDMQSDDRVEVVDLGVFKEDLEGSSYPSVAIAAGKKIAAGDPGRAILVCGTGIGVSIAANKVPGIRATVAHDSFSVERSILSNDCQILTLGQRVIGQPARSQAGQRMARLSLRPEHPVRGEGCRDQRLRRLHYRIVGLRPTKSVEVATLLRLVDSV
jgi:ribose 5-phosphate isomerase B